jgi:hypothetical protein
MVAVALLTAAAMCVFQKFRIKTLTFGSDSSQEASGEPPLKTPSKQNNRNRHVLMKGDEGEPRLSAPPA